MSIYNSKHRFLLSCAVALVLGGTFVVFRAITSPFLDVEHTARQFSSHKRTESTSTEAHDQARKWFPLHPWVAQARKYFHDGGRYVYCGDFGLINNDQSITVKPIAIIWHSEPDKAPVTVVAESAQLTSSEVISPNSTDFGRITSGFIAGNVRIDGPGGLRIVGRTFHLAEDSMKLFSSDPVTFAWGTHRGTAEKGVDIYLQSPEGASGGLTSVTDIRQVRLNGRVVCNMHVPAERNGDDPINIQIQAAGGFSFDMLTKTGTFSGVAPRTGEQRLKNAREEVWVRRLNPDKTVDHLVCPELKLQFRNQIIADPGQPTDNSLKLEHLTAWGRRVLFRSEQHRIQVDANEFRYALDERRIDIRHTMDGSSTQPKFVKVSQGQNLLYVPHIQILHSASGTVERVSCLGQGIVKASAPDAGAGSSTAASAASFGARWLKSMVMQVSPDQSSRTITLNGGASVSETSRDFDLSAQTIAMRLSSPPVDESQAPVKTSRSGAVTAVSHANSAADKSAAPSAFDVSAMRPEVITASENVALKSMIASGLLREKMTIQFEDMPTRTNSARAEKDTESPTSGQKSVDQLNNSDHMSFQSDVLEAVVGLNSDPDNRELEFRNVWLKGGVQITRESEDADAAFKATGNQLYAAGTQQSDLELKLFGDPARLSSSTRNLEGPRIDLTQINNEARVVGSGRIRFFTDKGFDGRMLPKPTPLDIYWSDHMLFQPRSAQFVGNIRVVLSDGDTEDMEVLCAGLTVHFSKDIALGQPTADREFEAVPTESESGTAEVGVGPIERIECHNEVTVRMEQFADGELNGRHRARFADLKLNLTSGDFTAVGPGYLESVSPDQDGQLQGPSPVTVRANTPSQTAETAFVYMRTEFIGGLNGNLHRREANLTQNVIALVAPARRVDEKISLQEVPTEQLPERAGLLQAEQLTISAIQAGATSENAFAIVARDNASLESRSLSASADVITYDHQKQQFIIRADDEGTVVVNHRSGPGGKLDRLVGKRFEYYRRTNQLNAAGFGGLKLTE